MKLNRQPFEPQRATLDAGDVSFIFPRHEWPETGIFAMTLAEFREATKEENIGDLFKRDIYEAKRKIANGSPIHLVAKQFGMRVQDLKKHLEK